MTTYARVQDGIVAELLVLDGPIDGLFDSSLLWVPLKGGQVAAVKPGHLYDGSSFSAPPPITPVAPPARTYKADIWRRCTDEEAAQLDAALAEAPAKLRRLWDDSQVIMHEADEFPALQASIAAIVGDDRADELLAASFYGG